MLSLPKTFIRPSGQPDSRFAFFGEQPGRREVELRKVFCGPAGAELDKQFDIAYIPRPFCYLSNIIKDYDAPPEEYIQLYKNNKLLKEPIISEKGKFYLELLRKEVSELTTPANGAFGAIALYALTGRTGINNWRGSILDCEILGTNMNKKEVIQRF